MLQVGFYPKWTWYSVPVFVYRRTPFWIQRESVRIMTGAAANAALAGDEEDDHTPLVDQEAQSSIGQRQAVAMAPATVPRRLPRCLYLVLTAGLLFVIANVFSLRRSMHDDALQRLRTALGDFETKSESFTASLWQTALQETQEPRGIVLPLYDKIAALGLSLILELRAMDVDLPIEIPYCGDLDSKLRDLISRKDPLVRIYDVCEQAANAKTAQDVPLFCNNLRHCHRKFRSFDIKLVAVVFSRFEEFMLMDADTLYFQSPMPLWELTKYKQTGTLFFHDRISFESMFLAELMPGNPNVTKYQHFLSTFDVTPFQPLGVISRRYASKGEAARARRESLPVKLPFKPSDFLLTSHSWHHRAGHQMDSSLVLWNKVRQPRATTILASFASMNGAARPPSYGDKELFFTACELAETAYAFSDFGVGSIGWEKRTYELKDSVSANTSSQTEEKLKEEVLCGEAVHYFPVALAPKGTGVSPAAGGPGKRLKSKDSLLYLNGDSILTWKPNEKPMFRSKARPAEYYPGSFGERDIPQECPFNITILELTPLESNRILQRQKLQEIVLEWLK